MKAKLNHAERRWLGKRVKWTVLDGPSHAGIVIEAKYVDHAQHGRAEMLRVVCDDGFIRFNWAQMTEVDGED